MKLDDLDRAVVAALLSDARQSFRSLARATGSTTPTVAARVRRLEAAGVLRGYHADVAPPEGTSSYVLTLRTRPADAGDVAAELANVEGVVETSVLDGGVVLVRAHLDPAGLERVTGHLADREALLGFDYARVLDTTPVPENASASAAVACHTCGGPVRGGGVHRHLGGRRHVFCCRHCAGTMEGRYDRLEADAGRSPGAERH